MSNASRPTSGARFLLELETAEATRATYRAAVLTPDAEYRTTAVLVEDGTVELGDAGAPATLTDMLAMFAKLLARGAPKRREDGLPVWPQRLLRWRDR